MQIIEIDGFVARCEAKGVQRDASLFMLQGEPLAINDFVMVHVGCAIKKWQISKLARPGSGMIVCC